MLLTVAVVQLCNDNVQTNDHVTVDIKRVQKLNRVSKVLDKGGKYVLSMSKTS